MGYCEKNIYVVETLLANPYKYGEEQNAPFREHGADCEICQASVGENVWN